VVALINLSQHNFRLLREVSGEKPPWWAFIGGIFGVGIVYSNAYAAPLIGTGMLMIFSVSGQLLCSILIQQFGWLGSTVKKIRPVQGLGLILILAGVVMAEML
jgi:transporter family-2 protein